MEDNLFHKMEMFNGSLIIINNYKPTWVLNLPFSSVVDSITLGLDKINEFLKFNADTESTTAKKNQVLESMLRSTEIICNAGITNASMKKDNELMAQFDFSYTDLKVGKEIEIYQRCWDVRVNAKLIEDDLIAVGLLATQLEEQNAFCTHFYPLIGGSHRVSQRGKSNKEEMLVVYAEMDVLYKEQMDNFMKMLKAANSKFYTEYKNSRVIGYWKKKKVATPVPPTE